MNFIEIKNNYPPVDELIIAKICNTGFDPHHELFEFESKLFTSEQAADYLIEQGYELWKRIY